MTVPGHKKSSICGMNRQSLLIQVIIVFIVILTVFYFYNNTQSNLQQQSIATGFQFLNNQASFDIGETLIKYTATDTYRRALLVGALNTVKVSIIGIFLTIILGTIIGIARLSSNWLIAKLAAVYVELFRNIPLLLQLFFWYSIFTEILPHPRKALNPIEGIYLTNRGFYFPLPEDHYTFLIISFLFIFGLLMTRFTANTMHLISSTRRNYFIAVFLLLFSLVIPLSFWVFKGMPTAIEYPELKGFNFSGGGIITPEFGALLLGLVIYTAAFIAEVVRAGILSVNKGQIEAAQSLGMRYPQILLIIIIPQALRVIIPPLTNQLLNLIKNSSLAVGIGYPDFVSVANTSINQTGQAIEGVALILVFYLFFSLVTSILMNWYNKRISISG